MPKGARDRLIRNIHQDAQWGVRSRPMAMNWPKALSAFKQTDRGYFIVFVEARPDTKLQGAATSIVKHFRLYAGPRI